LLAVPMPSVWTPNPNYGNSDPSVGTLTDPSGWLDIGSVGSGSAPTSSYYPFYGYGGGGGGAPSNGNACSVLSPNCKTMGPVATYLTFLHCENLSIMETITDEEDGVGPTAYGFINAGALASLRGAINTGKASPAGLVFAATAGLMDLGAIAKANSVCTQAIYGH